MLHSDNIEALQKAGFASDAIARAKLYIEKLSPIGAYSHSKGYPFIRERVAKYIQERDGGHPSHMEHIFLTGGASSGIRRVLQLIISNPNVCILLPRPQYPLYSATVTLLNGQHLYYDLDEDNGWSLSLDSIASVASKARSDGLDIRALVIINPGNPTGTVLSKENLEDIIKFCHAENIVLLADEVYQENIYYPERRPFYSAKKILRDLGPSYQSVELFSFHSISKGILGECGRRGGYFECTNIDDEVLQELYKLSSVTLCSTTIGQVMVDLMLYPPTQGDPSYGTFKKEYFAIYDSLKRRSMLMTDALRQLQGVTCQTPEGSMYVFPSYEFPRKFLEECAQLGKAPDAVYAMKLLQATGICGVNGSGFGQKPGSWHIRFTFLPTEDKFPKFLDLLRNFHEKFLSSYS